MLVAGLIFQKITGRNSWLVSSFAIWASVWIPASLILRLPMFVQNMGLFGFAGICLIYLHPDKQPKRPVRVLFALTLCVAGASTAFIFMNEKIDLSADSARYRYADKDESVPRNEMEVHALGGESRWFDPWGTYSWTTYSGHRLGPHIDGGTYYWGPSGLIRGDDLGRKLASWAGTKPVYQTRQELLNSRSL